jgi:hypothetical protein
MRRSDIQTGRKLRWTFLNHKWHDAILGVDEAIGATDKR